MYIIIGASSFIGVYTANYFISQIAKSGSNEKLIVTGRNDKFKSYYDQFPNVIYQNLDLTQKSDFEKLPHENISCVILIAGMLPASEDADLLINENAEQYIKTNTLGTIYALEFCRKHHIPKLINTISYADIQNSLTASNPIDDDIPRNFKHHGDHAVYVISKNAATDIMQYYNEQYGMNNVWFRLPAIYGVGPHGSLKVNGKLKKSGFQIFLEKAQNGEPISVYGNLTRDMTYVKDVARAYYLAANSNTAKGIYNISSGKSISLLDQARAFSEVFAPSSNNHSEIIYHESTENQGRSYSLSIDKAKIDFGFIPEFTDFKKMLIDYKNELELAVYSSLFADRDS